MSTEQIHTGLHANRLNDDGPSSGLEKAFAEQWQEEQRNHLLDYLLGTDNQRGAYSERDAQVAATVIQWLGTNVGKAFVDKVNFSVALQLSQSTN